MKPQASTTAIPRSRRTLRQRINRFLTVTFVVIGIIAVLTALSFGNLLRNRSIVLDKFDPAALGTSDWLSSLIDQENGVRGYLLSAGDTRFSVSYEAAKTNELAIREALLHELRDYGRLIDQVKITSAAIDLWQTDYAEPTITAFEGTSSSLSDPADQAGRGLFDQARTELNELEEIIKVERESAAEDLKTSTLFLLIAVVALAVMSVASKIGLWRAFTRDVAAPLDRLGLDATAIASGELDRTIYIPEYAELAELGQAMESMRQRLVSDLAALTEGQAVLVEKTQDLERSNTDLVQFAYVASHDLQEPLRKVISFCQLLQSRYGGQIDDRADEYIRYAVDGALRMQVLINDLLAFSRVGRVDALENAVDLNEVFEHAVSNLAAVIEESEAVIDHEPLPTITGDPALLVSLFQNLLGNAIKFQQPDIVPRISVAVSDQDPNWVLRVTDNGIGIDEEFQERVFAIFQRLHGREAYGGTGIGLAMCRKIVEHHGGTIKVEPMTQAGTRFKIELPKHYERSGQ